MMDYNVPPLWYIIQQLQEFRIHNPFDRAFQAENQRRGYVSELPVPNPIFSSFYESTIHSSLNNNSPESYISTASSSDYNFSDNRSSFSQAYFQKEAWYNYFKKLDNIEITRVQVDLRKSDPIVRLK